jgi:CheY-like chemotaxis protein
VVPLARSETRQAAELPESDGRLSGRTVLVVDDDARNVFALTGMLEFHGMRVLNAENGVKGIDVLRSDPSIELILMDVMMPEMDGYEATARIRSMPERADLPIIAVTAKAMQGDREKSLAAGATDYVTKPVDAAVLIDCIRRALKL